MTEDPPFAPRHFNWRLDAGIAVISLARPERKNPLTFDSYAELRPMHLEACSRPTDAVGARVAHIASAS